MIIIGISAFFHDSAAALVVDGELVYAAQEERFSRIKNDSSFPKKSIKFLLREAKIRPEDIDAIVFYDKPWLKFERIIENCIRYAPFSIRSFLKSMPSWLGGKLNTRKLIMKELLSISPDLAKLKVKFSEHHFSHAASSFYTSKFENACSVSIDGVGEWATLSIGEFENDSYSTHKEIHYPDSLGLFYSAMCSYCGFKVNSGEYKFMGLAAFGDLKSNNTQKFIKKIKKELITISDDGSFKLNLYYFSFHKNLKILNEKRVEKLLDLKKRDFETEISQDYCDFALATQVVLEDVLLKIITFAKSITSSSNLCLSGGVILNCVANTKIKDLGPFDNIWIHPAPGDAGGAAGCALGYYFSFNKHKKRSNKAFSPYLGPKFTDEDVSKLLFKEKISFEKLETEKLASRCAIEIEKGQVVGWFQGAMEWGPRALGNRSILASPLVNEMHNNLNYKVKNRENFRPFAPVVLKEDAHLYFDNSFESPYMQFVQKVSKTKLVSSTHINGSIVSRRDALRSPLPVITHIDFSARVQTVTLEQNPRLYQLISAFKLLSGCSVLVNTSFNVRGEPIVCTPKDAINCFLSTGIDVLIINNFIIYKKDIRP